jgi:hypothetical protein
MMKPDARFWKILFWETLENWPPVVGLALAVRMLSDSWLSALICLVVSTALGAIAIHFTEIRKFSNQPTLKESVVNFVVFTLLAILFLLYYAPGDTWWTNWVTDLGFGAIVGVALAMGESLGWSNTATLKTHALAMAIASALILLALRFLYRLQPFGLMLLTGSIVTLVISLIIVWIDYWPIKQPRDSV